MNTLEDALSFALERSYSSQSTMQILEAAPYDWVWEKITPVAFADLIQELEEQRVTDAQADAQLGYACSQWDNELEQLVDDGIMGTKLARVHFKEQPVQASLFEDLRFPTAGRDGRYRQVLAFEKSWQRADAAWVFKPGLALADFRARRKAIRDLEETHMEAERNERFERARLQHLATTLNGLCVDWYEVATALFAEPTVPGQLIRTVPTTYDPNRPPAPLRLVAQAMANSDDGQLSWRADRGVRFDIFAEGPAGGGFVRVINGVTEKRWTLRGLAPGVWRLKGYALNQFGQGKESEVVEITVAAVKAA